MKSKGEPGIEPGAFKVWELIKVLGRISGKIGQKGKWEIFRMKSLSNNNNNKKENISREASILCNSPESLSSRERIAHLFGHVGSLRY